MVMSMGVILFLGIIGSALGQQGSLLNPCDVEDLACLTKSTEQFLNNTASGIPQYDIRPIDPMVIPSIESDFHNIKYTYRNLTLIGLKDLKIADFKMDVQAKTVLLKTNVDVHYDSIINIDLKKLGKSFSGSYSGKGKAVMTSVYHYLMKTDDKGVEHFDVGKEAITCEALEAEVTLSDELARTVEGDADMQQMKKKLKVSQEQMLKSGLCKLLQVAYPNVIHNIRAAAKILPKNAFFSNI